MRAKVAFETPWFSVEELAPGQESNPFDGPFYRLRMPDGVICLILDEADRFVMVRQFRPAIQAATLEFPAGAIDPGETVAEAAARELREETGHVCPILLPLGAGGLYINRVANTEHFMLGLGARPLADWRPEPGVERVFLPRAAFPALVTAGGFAQVAALAAVVMADVRLGLPLLTAPLERLTEAVRRAAGA